MKRFYVTFIDGLYYVVDRDDSGIVSCGTNFCEADVIAKSKNLKEKQNER